MTRSKFHRCTAGILTSAAFLFSLMAHAQSASSEPVQFNFDRPAEYTWKNVKIVAGGFITGILYHPTVPGLAYARTDIGGAYRYDPLTHQWISMTDLFNQNDWNLIGTESIGIDPVAGNRVYLAQGTYTQSWAGNGAILRSRDFGVTFDRVDLPFKMGANESGRYSGERLSVDPQNHKDVYLGTRNNGLWKSTDFGATWNQLTSFPVAGPTAGVGVIFVVFQPTGTWPTKTETIYAGVSDPTTGLYSSTDDGATWTPVAGQPTGFFPNHQALGPDGNLYVTYGDGTGADGMGGTAMRHGAVWKYNTSTAIWTNITPLGPWWSTPGYGFGAVAVDRQHPSTIMTSTLDRWWPGDEVYRSVDGGATWVALGSEPTGSEPGPPYNWSVRDDSLSPYLSAMASTSNCSPTACDLTKGSFGWWLGSLAIDPFDSNHVEYGTGATIWETHDVTNVDAKQMTHWAVGADGIEETAVLSLVSPTAGAHLISGLGDIGGFRHDNLDQSPRQGMSQPYYTPVSIDFAENDPNLIVRGPGWGHTNGAYSTDNGVTWIVYPGIAGGPRSIAVSPDGNHWVLAPNSGAPQYSINWGSSWTPSTGAPSGAGVVSDRFNSLKFYSFDWSTHSVFVSTDGGVTFAAAATGLAGGNLYASPAAEGDLWLATGTGMLHSTDSGATFQKVGNVQQAFNLGFGKGAYWSTYPAAMYLSGQVRGVLGIFRSLDGGLTWLQINDRRHQWGAVSPITGDRRVFGRVYIGTNGRGIIWGDIEAPDGPDGGSD